MIGIQNFQEAETELMRYMPLVKTMTGRDITLERILPVMKALGNPHEKLKAIHIAGTSGKTSTTYYITALLVASGKKIGTTVSPHIDSIAERVQINGEPLSEKVFCEALNECLEIIKIVEITPSYFELMIAFAFWYFAKAGVDYAVVETGMGGLHDATNILQRKDKVCVITDIGFDHMEILGNTLPAIAAQKAGIIHEGNAVLMYEQGNEIMEVFKKRAIEKQAELKIINAEADPAALTMPIFQQRNWHLALQTFRYVQKRDGLQPLDQAQIGEAIKTQVPARMDERALNGKTLIMDGAHNAQKMEAFVSGIQKQFPGKKAAILMSLKSGKEHADIFPLLKQIGNKLIITSFQMAQDIPLQSTSLLELSDAAKKHFPEVKVLENQDDAYRDLLASEEDLLIITGSFYLIGQLRSKHKELKYA